MLFFELVTVTLQCYNKRNVTIEGEREKKMNCKYCGNELPAGINSRREFCNDAHKQAYYRQKHQQDQAAALLAELEQLRTQVRDQKQELDEQASEISRLRERLDLERRYLEDSKQRGFKSFLRKRSSSPLIERLLTDVLFKDRDTLTHYQYYLRHHFHCTEEEMQEFASLWKVLLLSQP